MFFITASQLVKKKSDKIYYGSVASYAELK